MEISAYILAVAIAWIAAQGLKYIYAMIRHHKFDRIRQLYFSGGMPSAHSSSVIALVTVVALKDGVEGGLFALSLLFAAIVMYDAMMVRRSSGEQGIALQKLIREQGSTIPLPRAARGHTPLEVIVGALVGALIGLVVFLATK